MIAIHDKLEPEVEFENWIHEMLHACLWDLDEDAVRETGESLAKALWRLGYRKKPDER